MKKLGFIVLFLMLTLLLGSSLGACIAPSDKLVEFAGPNNSKISAFVTVPVGDGPFPAVVMAHGSYGFDGPPAVKSYLNVAQRFTSDGAIPTAAQLC